MVRRRSNPGSSAALLIVAAACLGAGKGSLCGVSGSQPPTRLYYRVDSSRSRLVIETHTRGASSTVNHDHEIRARRLAGSVSFIPVAPETASLDFRVRADSLAVMDQDVSEEDRRDIERTVRRRLETTKYPQISFHGTGATAEVVGPAFYQVTLRGELLLHGVRKELTVPVQVVVQADALRVRGSCRVRQSEYLIAPISDAGLAAIEDEVTVSFELVVVAAPQRAAIADPAT
jgi:polyisoprenoid-binding protein YceI